ncbi:hypothetical protein HHK36_000635 [Tetracentron sinense]|uniref:BED-type domain-containing protein n=1 Tax=Tetracentron sinense TaxID=13715 RepID=A0A835DU72_TETSI|nr:hypothetical protein HHK36_000635 [Tetracentron sinense]
MGKKKKRASKVWCYYCDREFDDEKILVQHQKARHFKCHVCQKKLSTAGGMAIHVLQVHKESVTKVPNAKPERESTEIEIFGMQGIPPDILAAHYGEQVGSFATIMTSGSKGDLDSSVSMVNSYSDQCTLHCFTTCDTCRILFAAGEWKHRDLGKIITSDPYVTVCLAGATVAQTIMMSSALSSSKLLFDSYSENLYYGAIPYINLQPDCPSPQDLHKIKRMPIANTLLDSDEDAPSKLAKVEIPSSKLFGGAVPGSVGIGFHPQTTFGAMRPNYNTALQVPPSGWPVPARPQPWFPQHPVVSLPPAAPMGLAQQPLFPIQNVKPPLPSTTSPTIKPSFQINPPGLPPSMPPIPVSQPLFPISGNNNIPTQNSPFSASALSTTIPSSSPAELKNSVDSYSSANTSIANSYNDPSIQGGIFVNSHTYASRPNTGGPSIGPPPVIANKILATQPAPNEVYLVWDDEAMSMEERRMSLVKYQVHDETSQVFTLSLLVVSIYKSDKHAAIDSRVLQPSIGVREHIVYVFALFKIEFVCWYSFSRCLIAKYGWNENIPNAFVLPFIAFLVILYDHTVHSDWAQMNSVDAAIDRRISESRLAGRMTF